MHRRSHSADQSDMVGTSSDGAEWLKSLCVSPSAEWRVANELSIPSAKDVSAPDTTTSADAGDNAGVDVVDQRAELWREARELFKQVSEIDLIRCVEFIRTFAIKPNNELVRDLLVSRRRYIADGGRLFTAEEIESEIDEIRHRERERERDAV